MDASRPGGFVKITAKNGNDFRPKAGEFSTTTLIELTPDKSAGHIPTNVVLLVDSSSSMGGNKWAMVKSAVAELVGSLHEDDRVGLVLFHSSAKEVFPLASLSQNRDVMLEAVKKLDAPSGVTNLEEGLKVAYKGFDTRSDGDKVKRVNHVILLTDGFPTDNQGYRVEKTERYEAIVRQHENITLTGVGIGSADEYDSDFINRLSELGRGSYYHANDLAKFKEGMQAELSKLQSSVVGDLVLKFTDLKGKILRIAKVAPEIVIYDLPGNSRQFDLSTGSMQKDTTAFIVQTSSVGDGASAVDQKLFTVTGSADGKLTEAIDVIIKTTDKDADLTQVDPDVMRAMQALQVHLNGQQIQASLEKGDKDRATRLIDNTTRIASSLGQDKVTRALTRLATDIKKGNSVSDDLATIKDEAKKTKLLIR